MYARAFINGFRLVLPLPPLRIYYRINEMRMLCVRAMKVESERYGDPSN